MRRPALAEVLARLSPFDLSADVLAERRVVVEADRVGVGMHRPAPESPDDGATLWHRWNHPGPAEALEALQTAGLAPADDGRRRWWCAECAGSGLGDVDPEQGLGYSCACEDGTTPHPPDIPTLVAVASLGAALWQLAEELARVVERDAAVAWRASPRSDIQRHHEGSEGRRAGSPIALAFSREARDDEWSGGRGAYRQQGGRRRWQEACPYRGWFGTGVDDDPHGVHRAWPALRALFHLGVHLVGHRVGHHVGHQPGLVTLAVELPRSAR